MAAHRPRAALLLSIAIAVAGCKRPAMASRAQCERLFDRFVDLELSEDRRAPALTSEDRARLRATLATESLAEPAVRRLRTRCESDVTEAQYACALQAPSPGAWLGCMR